MVRGEVLFQLLSILFHFPQSVETIMGVTLCHGQRQQRVRPSDTPVLLVCSVTFEQPLGVSSGTRDIKRASLRGAVPPDPTEFVAYRRDAISMP